MMLMRVECAVEGLPSICGREASSCCLLDFAGLPVFLDFKLFHDAVIDPCVDRIASFA